MILLRDYLLDAYGHPDRRFKDLDQPIKVDDRDAGDVHSQFCSIHVLVPDRTGDRVVLTLQDCPAGPEVLELVQKLGGSILPTDARLTITLPLRSSQGPAIRRLARAIKSIVGRGRTYDDPNLRWICPRASASLEALGEHLDSYRTLRDEGPEGRSSDPILARPREPMSGMGDTAGPYTSNGTLGGMAGDRR